MIMNRKQKKVLLRIVIAAVLMILLGLLPVTGLWRFLLYLLPYFVIGYDVLWEAAIGIWNRQVFDENFLMAVATVGALVLGVLQTGDYVEAVAVMLFYQIGELFQSVAVGKSRRNIAKLMDIRPDYANIELDGALVQTDPDEVAVGTVIVAQPGEKIPIDGIIVSGSSVLNTSALTGESLPREVTEGAEVLSGCINMTGVLKIRTTKPFGESTVSKILELVENASSNKSRSEKFISRFARIYTPAVCYSALALLILPPVISLLIGHDPLWNQWLYRALSFLVASCPCALVISIPLTFFASIGGASKAGVLVKGSNYIETLAKVDTVVFDKTGTLTKGVFQVTAIAPVDISSESLLEYAAYADSASSHPISKSLLSALGRHIDRSRVCDIQEIGGHGVTAMVDGRRISVGNRKLMAQFGIDCPDNNNIGTVVYVGIDGQFAGSITISDVLKPTAAAAMNELKTSGIRNAIMLTGDSAAAAQDIANKLGIHKFYSDLLPADKVSKVEELLRCQKRNAALAFVGDGINDAPVLSRADIGIAMGAMGSDAAIEAADVVLMDDDPMKIVTAIRICRKCLSIVRQNIFFAIGIKLLALVLVAIGSAGMWLAIFADVGVMVLAILNSIRALVQRK